MTEPSVFEPGFVRYKDPNAVGVVYTITWTDWLDGKTIVSASWIIEPDDGNLLKVDESNSTTQHSIRLAGGELGVTYTVTSRIVDSNDEGDDRSFRLVIVNR